MDYLMLRLASAALAGAILSQTGSLIQLSTRNLLASPSTLGFDGLAVLWVLVFHSALLFLGGEPTFAATTLIGAGLFVFLGVFFSEFFHQHRRIERLILIGLTFNLFIGAVFALWQFLFVAFNRPFPVELWFGHFRFATTEGALVLLAVEAFILAGWVLLRRQFLLFSLGETVAANLNLEHRRLYRFMFVSISLGTFAVVSLFGAFSFLGLVFPVVARKLWFRRFDLPGEFVLGAIANGCLLMAVDLACYLFPVMGAEIPVGLIACAVGALSLILLLWKFDNRLEILAKK
jgi:iron complex transport system permease protein